MVYNSSYYEEEYLDSDEQGFQKLPKKKAKTAKQDKKAPIREKREEKLRQQSLDSNKTFTLIC